MGIILTILELSEVVFFTIFLEMLLELLSLLLDMLGDLIIYISEEVINGRLCSFNSVLESLTDGGTSFFTEAGCVFGFNEAATSQVLLEAFDGRPELRQELLPFLHLFLITIALREVTG